MNILLAESSAATRAVLRQVLNDVCPDGHVVEVADLDGALTHMRADTGVALVLWGLAPSFLHYLKPSARTATIVLVVSERQDSASLQAALDVGARGFVGNAAPDIIAMALRFVLSGGVYIPNPAPTARPTRRLTRRQVDVLRLLSQGKSNREIGGVLGLTEGTVKLHVSAVLKALEVSNRTQAVLAARSV